MMRWRLNFFLKPTTVLVCWLLTMWLVGSRVSWCLPSSSSQRMSSQQLCNQVYSSSFLFKAPYLFHLTVSSLHQSRKQTMRRCHRRHSAVRPLTSRTWSSVVRAFSRFCGRRVFVSSCRGGLLWDQDLRGRPESGPAALTAGSLGSGHVFTGGDGFFTSLLTEPESNSEPGLLSRKASSEGSWFHRKFLQLKNALLVSWKCNFWTTNSKNHTENESFSPSSPVSVKHHRPVTAFPSPGRLTKLLPAAS